MDTGNKKPFAQQFTAAILNKLLNFPSWKLQVLNLSMEGWVRNNCKN